VDAARAKYGPSIVAEGVARAGYDIDGDNGDTSDLQARLVLRWNLYRGGIDKANEQEQVRRTSEQRLAQHQVLREIEEAVRTSWDRRFRQADLAKTLKLQAASSEKLVASYREQFKVGQRSLLDVLDAQNTRNNVQAQTETARLAKLYAQYRVLAATNKLIEALGVAMPAAASSDQRARFHVNPIPPADLDENSMPLPAMGPPAPAGGSN
jgi:outer membrane protein, adhesin transport system